MEGFIRNQDFKLWKSVLEGPFIPAVPAAGAGGAHVPKDPVLYSDEDYKRMEVDSKALWLIQMDIPNSIIHAFKKCKYAQELWNSLQQMYVQLVDELVAAGVKMENQNVIRKFLRSLPQAWNIYSVAIRRTENLRTLKLSELFDILSAYQMEIDAQEPKPTHATFGSAALYAPIKHSPYQRAFMAKETNYFHLCQEDLDEQDFADWSFQAEDASISNSALMANDSTSSFKVTDDMCTPECLEKLNVFKRINSQLCNELESPQVVKENFFESERNYKEKIEEMEKTISSLKHEDTNKQCQINNLLERLTTAKTDFVLAESYRDKFLSQGEKYEKLFRMSDTSELVRKMGAGLGYNKVEPPSAYTPMVEIRCKPVTNLVYDEVLDIHKVAQSDDLSYLNPSNSTCSDEDDTPIKPETEKPGLKTKKRTKKTKKHSLVFIKAKNIQTGSTSSDDYVTCPSDKSKRGRSKERKVNFSRKQVNPQANKSVGTSKPSPSVNQSSAFIKKDQQLQSLNNQTICLMCGETNHLAADCLYNPRRRIFSENEGRGRKKSWSKSSSSSDEQGRNPVKKVSEATTSDNWKKNIKKASDGKKASEAHAKRASDKPRKFPTFGRRPSKENQQKKIPFSSHQKE
ncbi:hypothetical protein E3N88_09885 [Mikania micrantha]|uniref:CCHC-type domain-containing protein n=1 Tax=Mikania micrantha TaxID=192012 RepID=A0A5N6PKB2_9ASTR|nr:hypothetical protein E3N88_09885 [Mikania micrantha]